jgi:hypothetical protein
MQHQSLQNILAVLQRFRENTVEQVIVVLVECSRELGQVERVP